LCGWNATRGRALAVLQSPMRRNGSRQATRREARRRSRCSTHSQAASARHGRAPGASTRHRPCPHHQRATGERLYVTTGHRISARWPMVADFRSCDCWSISALSSATPQTQQREAAAARQGLKRGSREYLPGPEDGREDPAGGPHGRPRGLETRNTLAKRTHVSSSHDAVAKLSGAETKLIGHVQRTCNARTTACNATTVGHRAPRRGVRGGARGPHGVQRPCNGVGPLRMMG
jgi:hypothetical protein